MGPEVVKRSPLGMRLEDEFGELTFLREDAGSAVWSGYQSGARVAIHTVRHPAGTSSEQLQERCQELQSRQWPFLPKLLSVFDCAHHTVIVEEWLEGAPWGSLELSPQRYRELGAELFDILAALHLADLYCGSMRADQLLLGSDSRLRLLHLLTNLGEGGSWTDDRAAALALLQPFLEPAELDECATCQTASQVSRLLRRQKPGRGGGEPLFLGRELALKRLDRCLAETHLLTVEAPAGGGKTRLLKHWCAQRKTRVLWAKAEREVAPSPFQMFAGPIAQLEDELTRRPDLATLLVHELGVELPLMRGLRGRTDQEPGLQRGILVMLGLMLTVFGRDKQTVLVLDDCQWADPLTLRFLEHWAASGDSLLVVATYRSEEVDSAHPLRRLQAESMSLPPLDDEQADRLLLSHEPRASLTLRETAIRQAQGNPFLLLSYLRGGKLHGDSDMSRFGSLPQAAKVALGAASVLGREFTLQTVQGCLDQPADLAPALSEGLLEPTVSGYRFVHDRVRDLVFASLHPDEVSALHLKAARHLASADPGSVFEIAFHFQAAGQPSEGFEHSLAAAAQADREHDSSTTIFYLEAALAGCDAGYAPALRHDLLERLGDCHRLTGQYRQALAYLEQAFSLAGSAYARAQLKLKIGDVEFKQGELERARLAVEEGLELLGGGLPKFLPLAFLRQAFIQIAHTYFPGRFQGRRVAGPKQPELLLADLYNRLAYIRWFLEGPVPSIFAHLHELNLAEKFSPTRTLARARATHAIAMGAFPLWGRALRFGRSALEIAESLGDDWCQGQAAHFYGAALLGSSKLEQAREQLEAAVKKLQQTGDRWEENGARYHLALVYYRLGRSAKATALARETQGIGVDIDDRLAAGDNLFTWARASGGLLPAQALEREKTFTNPDIQRAGELLGAEAVLCLRQGEFERAAGLLEQGIALYRSRRAQSPYAATLPCWLVTAHRLLAQVSPSVERATRLRQAKRSLKLALRQARKYRNNLAHALREQALLCALEGRLAAARRSLQDSLRVARDLGMAQEEEIGHALAARWGWLLGDDHQAPKTDRFDWLLSGPRPSQKSSEVSVAQLLEATQLITSSRSVETALHQLCRACKTLLKAESASVVTMPGGRLDERLSGDAVAPPAEGLDSPENGFVLCALQGDAYLWLARPGDPLNSQEQDMLDVLVQLAGVVMKSPELL